MSGYLDSLFSPRGRVAVVTGGSSGIGEGMATALARAGARVVLVARGEKKLASVAAALRDAGCEAAWYSTDLAERSLLSPTAAALSQFFGEPDILVNCAGVNLRPPMAELTTADWDLTLALNLPYFPARLRAALDPPHSLVARRSFLPPRSSVHCGGAALWLAGHARRLRERHRAIS